MKLVFTSCFFSAFIYTLAYSDEVDDHVRKNATHSSDTVFACPAFNGRYPHRKDCSLFYECRFGYPHLMKCDKYKLYDDKKQQCESKCSVDCNRKDQNKKELDNDETFKCPYVWGTFAHPKVCSKYYVCVQNIPILFQCYGLTLFDTSDQKCLERNRVDCKNRLDRDDITGTESFSTSSIPITATIPVTASSSTINPITTNRKNTTTSPIYTTSISPTPTTTTMLKSSTIRSTLTPAPSETAAESSATTVTSKPMTTLIPTTAKISTTLKFLTPTTSTEIPTTATETPTIATETPTTATETPTKATETPITATETATKNPTFSSTHKIMKPNTPPPTNCDENDLECILDKTGDVSDWFECPGNGLFPHGSSQQLFIHCDNEKPFVQMCGEDTYFSPEYEVCMWIEKHDNVSQF